MKVKQYIKISESEGQTITKVMREKKLRQMALVSKLNISQSYLSRSLKGEKSLDAKN